MSDPCNKEILQHPESAYSSIELVSRPFIDGLDLEPERINQLGLYGEIEAAGFNLKLTEEQRELLTGKQFRNYQTGRGIAMRIVLGERIDAFEEILEAACFSYRRSIKGDRNRGARQLAADLVTLSVGAFSSSYFSDKTNRRAQKSRGVIDDPITGLPPQAALQVVEFLTRKKK